MFAPQDEIVKLDWNYGLISDPSTMWAENNKKHRRYRSTVSLFC